MAAQFDNRISGGLAARGVIAILFGIVALARPGITATGLVYVFGVFAFIDGVAAIGASANVAQMKGRWWPILLAGIAGIVIGVIAFTRPTATAVGLVTLLAIWAIATGLLEVAGAFRLRKVVQGEWILAVAGLLSIAFGIMIAARPGAGMLTIVWLIGAYAIIFGALEIGLAVRLRGAQRRLATS